ncbi:PRADC1 family protein [Megaselia abdita]
MQLYSSLVLLVLIQFRSLSCDEDELGTGQVQEDNRSAMHFNSVTTSAIIGNDAFFEITDPPSLGYTYRIRPAKDFGRGFNELKLQQVRLIPTVPENGCSFFKNSKKMKGHVALVDRGDCTFQKKALYAQMAGAKVILVTENNVSSPEFDYYIEMVHDNSSSDPNIPAAFLLGKNGLIIKETLKKLKRSYAVINLPQNLTFVPAYTINHPPWLSL